MKRTILLISACALGLSACGGSGGGTQTVEGTTTPPKVDTQQQAQAPSPATQTPKLKQCLGGKETTRVDVFEPTYQYAKANTGDGFAIRLKGRQIEFLVLPSAAAAQTAYKDASNQLINAQQTKPDVYKTVASTAMQVVGNVVEIVPTGAPSPKVNAKIVGCVTKSAG